MKTILLGYADRGGHTPAKVLAGPAVSTVDQSKIFDAAKRRHEFPKGIKRIEQRILQDECEVAIFIDPETSTALAGRHEEEQKRIQEAKQKRAAENNKSAALAEAEHKVKTTASTRNELLARMNEVKSKLRNAEIAQEKMPSELHAAALESAKSLLLGDPAKKIAGLESEVTAAIAEYEHAVSALNQLKNPAPTEPKTT